MTERPKYDPPIDPPRLVVASDSTKGFRIQLEDDVYVASLSAGHERRDVVALAIADRVHGPKLARLRAVEDTWIDLVKRLREVVIDELREPRAVGDMRFSTPFGVEIFDEVSLALGLPCSNDDGVPFELLPPAPEVPFKPMLRQPPAGRQWWVVWGDGLDDRTLHGDLEVATADFGERYAAWKAAQR